MKNDSRSPKLLRALACAVFGAVAWSVWISSGSAQTLAGDSPFGEPARLLLDRASLRAMAGGPELVEKVDASAFRYFRLLAREFAGRTCEAFRDLRWRLPFVAVHGDAHCEQFVVTDSCTAWRTSTVRASDPRSSTSSGMPASVHSPAGSRRGPAIRIGRLRLLLGLSGSPRSTDRADPAGARRPCSGATGPATLVRMG